MTDGRHVEIVKALSLAISEIFSVHEWPDREIWVWGRSRSLKMARFDRSSTTFYWSSIVYSVSKKLCIFIAHQHIDARY